MEERYRILYQGGEAELVEKKSRFIATAKPISAEQEAELFITGMKKQYWDAAHNCSAFVLGARGQIMRCSDDGEPAQTAGRPMLDVLIGEQIRDICVVVTRYFGGTLLGTGGLVRAYAGAVQQVLKQCVILDKLAGKKISVVTNYQEAGKLQYLFHANNIVILDTIYTEKVELIILCPVLEAAGIKKRITEATRARADISESEQIYYGKSGEKIIFF